MARRCGNNFKTANCDFVPPVQLDYVRFRNSPIGQMGTNPERHHERADTQSKRLDGSFVQMVIVVVRDDYGIKFRQLVNGDSRSMPATRTEPGQGRWSLAPDRVSQHAMPIYL